jgi:hypothetical protein
MPKNNKPLLEGVSFEDIMSEVGTDPTSDSALLLQRGREYRSERPSNAAIDFQIIKNYGRLSNRNNAPTFALVAWNGYKRYDLRAWNEDYTVPFKGLTLSADEVEILFTALSEYVPKQYSTPLHVIDMGKTKVRIYHVLSELSSATVKEKVWNKQISIVDWGYGPKYDFRKWTDDYAKCSKGICLNQNEIDSLLGIIGNLDL